MVHIFNNINLLVNERMKTGTKKKKKEYTSPSESFSLFTISILEEKHFYQVDGWMYINLFLSVSLPTYQNRFRKRDKVNFLRNSILQF